MPTPEPDTIGMTVKQMVENVRAAHTAVPDTTNDVNAVALENLRQGYDRLKAESHREIQIAESNLLVAESAMRAANQTASQCAMQAGVLYSAVMAALRLLANVDRSPLSADGSAQVMAAITVLRNGAKRSGISQE